MPIPQDEISTNWIWASASETVAQVRARLPGNRNEAAYKYIVWAAGGGRYVVVRWYEIEDLARMQGAGILQQPIGSLVGLPPAVEGADRDSTSKQAAGELRDAQPGKRLVVLAGGVAVGIMTREL